MAMTGIGSDEPFKDYPQSLTVPASFEGNETEFVAWSGHTTFGSDSERQDGHGKVFLERQNPVGFEFSFTPDLKPTLQQQAQRFASASPEDFRSPRTMQCGGAIGQVECQVFGVGETTYGSVTAQIELDKKRKSFTSAKVLIFNGPKARGSVVRFGRGMKSGRWSVDFDDATVTVDELELEENPKRNAVYNTHVAELQYSKKVSVRRIERDLTTLHRTLSFMMLRWVGIVGPWLSPPAPDGTNILKLGAKKCQPFGHSGKWYSSATPRVFEQLFVAMHKNIDQSDTGMAIETALHWTMESSICAGGIEGSLILQQAALECLSWLEVCSKHSICSTDGFKSLKAVDKIRWLLSIHKIDYTIPSHCEDIRKFAADNKHNDLVDVLVANRNILVHAEPRSATELFRRDDGTAERAELWYQIGGLLHQAVLASVGYTGDILVRGVGSGWEAEAIQKPPWDAG